MTKLGDITFHHRTGQQMAFLKTGAETAGSLLQDRPLQSTASYFVELVFKPSH